MNSKFAYLIFIIILACLIFIDPKGDSLRREKKALQAQIDSLQTELMVRTACETKPVLNKKVCFYENTEKESFEIALQKIANGEDFEFTTPVFKNRFVVNVFTMDAKEFRIKIRVNPQEAAQSSFTDYSITGIYTMGERDPKYGLLHIEDVNMIPYCDNIHTDRVAAVLCDFGHRWSERLLSGLNINQIHEYRIKSQEFVTEIQEFMKNPEIRHRLQQQFIVQSVLDAYYYNKK